MEAPMNDLIRVTVSGSMHKARAVTRRGLALRVSELQTQPGIVVDWGLKTKITLCGGPVKLSSSSIGVHLKSSAKI